MKIRTLVVGKIKEREVRATADDYLKRIARYTKIEEREVKSDRALGEAIQGDTVVALEVNGKRWTSEEFSRQVESWSRRGKGEITFLIGGAEGIPKELSVQADHQMSLSSMTLPHRIARVILYEQIYRAFTIQRGEPYAREG
ncbi:MAG: 23S rRNA (pseudouridine(1915)-N(3))-methyltransferase RlmH [Polyangiaceae bacterium]|nr:23S rRNA (pseudouridine(1915)-N(3))-methyltransferase RlmH [Polyangiaceae bacterium]